jgi:UDPglucose 6-dehydrogenase
VKVGVIGTGHVGLIACVTLAEIGHEVVGTDADQEKIELLMQGSAPFYEPGLQELLTRNLQDGRLTFTSHTSQAVIGAEVVFICVGTPARATGEANLLAVERATREVGAHVDGSLVLVQKSTVPAGTSAKIRRALQVHNPKAASHVQVVSNPEFLREGRAIQDSLQPDRILVGAESRDALLVMRRLYAPLIDQGCVYIETDVNTAELAKHASNAFLALKISYANALARICELAGADVTAVAQIMGSDPRIGKDFLNAGLGYGGFCFPKDVQAFHQLAARLGYDFPLLREVARINDEAVEATLEKVRDGLWNLEDKTVALLGLAFKPGTDDVRLAPALALARRLLAEGARVVGYDPEAMAGAKDEVPELELASDAYSAAAGAHCVVVCTEWLEFRALDLRRLGSVMAHPFMVDGRNMFEPDTVAAAGFNYHPTGRPPAREGRDPDTLSKLPSMAS